MNELEATAQILLDQGDIDTVVKVDYRDAARKPILKKHFGKEIQETHDFRNAPIYAYLFAYEVAQTNYFSSL
jgi:hypothetical protein